MEAVLRCIELRCRLTGRIGRDEPPPQAVNVQQNNFNLAVLTPEQLEQLDNILTIAGGGAAGAHMA